MTEQTDHFQEVQRRTFLLMVAIPTKDPSDVIKHGFADFFDDLVRSRVGFEAKTFVPS